MKTREEEKQQSLQSLIKYIKEDDIETCINALFVLTDSKPEGLERLMRNLTIEKRDLIYMLGEILSRNYEAYKEIMQGGHKGGFGGFPYRANYHH